MTRTDNAYAPADQLVVSVSIEGIAIKMSGDKRLLGVRIPPEILREWRREKLEETLALAVNRARAVADLEAGRATFLGLTREDTAQGLRDIAAETPGVMAPTTSAVSSPPRIERCSRPSRAAATAP